MGPLLHSCDIMGPEDPFAVWKLENNWITTPISNYKMDDIVDYLCAVQQSEMHGCRFGKTTPSPDNFTTPSYDK